MPDKNTTHAESIKEILGLDRDAVGVKFLKDLDQPGLWKDYDNTKKMRYCQALMLAGEGNKIILGSENIACAAAGAAFGLMPLHPRLASGEGHFNTGIFGSAESAALMMRNMPRLEQGAYSYVALAPLSEMELVPDVIVVEAAPEIIMWLSLAAIYHTGERLQLSTSIVQATCVDATVIPFKNGKPNGSFGCTGCREATDLGTVEALIGFPGRELSVVVKNLKLLSEKVIPKNRKKSIFNKFIKPE